MGTAGSPDASGPSTEPHSPFGSSNSLSEQPNTPEASTKSVTSFPSLHQTMSGSPAAASSTVTTPSMSSSHSAPPAHQESPAASMTSRSSAMCKCPFTSAVMTSSLISYSFSSAAQAVTQSSGSSSTIRASSQCGEDRFSMVAELSTGSLSTAEPIHREFVPDPHNPLHSPEATVSAPQHVSQSSSPTTVTASTTANQSANPPDPVATITSSITPPLQLVPHRISQPSTPTQLEALSQALQDPAPAPAPAHTPASILTGSSGTSTMALPYSPPIREISQTSHVSPLSSNRSDIPSEMALIQPQIAPLTYIDTIDSVELLEEVASAQLSNVRRLQAAQASTAMQLSSAQRDHAYIQNRIQVLQLQRQGNGRQLLGATWSSVQNSGASPAGRSGEPIGHTRGHIFDPSQLPTNYNVREGGSESRP